MTKQKKRPFVKNIEKNFNKVNDRMKARYDEIRTEIIRKCISDYKPLLREDTTDFSDLISAEVLLENAIEALREEWEEEKKRKNRIPIELPAIDFDELRKKFDYIP